MSVVESFLQLLVITRSIECSVRFTRRISKEKNPLCVRVCLCMCVCACCTEKMKRKKMRENERATHSLRRVFEMPRDEGKEFITPRYCAKQPVYLPNATAQYLSLFSGRDRKLARLLCKICRDVQKVQNHLSGIVERKCSLHAAWNSL